MIFGMWNPEWENLTWKSYRLSTSPVRYSYVPWEIEKSHFQQYYSYILLIIFIISQKTICNPPAHSTWKCHHTNLWTVKLSYLTEGLLRSFRRWRLWKKPVVGCRRWLGKEPVVMCGNWNVRQVMSQQVFKVTTFCINSCFQFFSAPFSRVVHHAVLKFSVQPTSQQAATASLNTSSCIVPQTPY